jgi:hypothetical protein
MRNESGVEASDWIGLSWSSPIPLKKTTGRLPDDGGLYRIWDPKTASPLEYIGETVTLSNRINSHRRSRDGELYVSYR